MKYILLLSSLSTMASPVIISESIVRAPDHIVPLSLLAKGYKVASLAKDKRTKALAEIKNHKKTTVDQLYLIRAGDKLVRAAHGQTFYDPQLQKWVKSEDLTTANHLLDEQGKRVSVNSIVHKVGQFPAIEVTVDGSHYLYSDGVLTHNDGGASIVIGGLLMISHWLIHDMWVSIWNPKKWHRGGHNKGAQPNLSGPSASRPQSSTGARGF